MSETIENLLNLHGELEQARLDLAAARDEIKRLRKEVGERFCGSCFERHPFGTMCPPHETRTVGLQWFRDRIEDAGKRLAASRKERDDIQQELNACKAEIEQLRSASLTLYEAALKALECGGQQ